MNIKPFLLLSGAIVLSFSSFTVSPVVAQQSDASKPMQLQRGMNRLNLTEDQRRQMNEIREWTQTEIGKVIGADNLAKLQSARQNGGKIRGQMKDLNLTDTQKQAIRGIREEAQRRMQGILTEEQRTMLQQKRQGRQNNQRQQSRMQQQPTLQPQ